jgi:cytochrome P450
VARLLTPPGPKLPLLDRLFYAPARDPLGFFHNLARTYGDIAYVRVGGERLYLLSNPRDIRDVLVTNQHQFAKGRGLERARRLLGRGLLTSEGELHRRQRRLMQPAFHRDRIAGYATIMTGHAERVRNQWRERQTIDVAQEMMRLTLGIVGKTLFDVDVDDRARDIGRALTAVLESFWLAMMLPFGEVVEHLPVPAVRRARKAREELDAIIYRMIAERRAAMSDRGDLLSMLLLAQDDEGGGMSDRQVRDEAMTILLAGHETVANALSWTFHLLGGAPEVERRLHQELERVLGGRLPRTDDIPSLAYVEQVVTESMRLFPPAWMIGRRALEDCVIGGYAVPARSLVLMSPYLVHRDGRLYEDPERFRPDRWTAGFTASLAPFAYLPFGGGTRRCIGDSFAWMELILVLATIAQHWSLEAVPGHPVVPRPVVTLRLKHGLKMTPVRRLSG